MNSLEKVIESVRGQRFILDSKGGRESNCSIIEKAGKVPKKDILFFPRKMLKVRKIEKSNAVSESYFIEDRTNEKATCLERPTELTGEALTSGLRCGIILNNEGKYVKLKGISPKTFFAQGGVRGLCHPIEAYHEHFFAHFLEEAGFPYLPAEPRFVETALLPSDDLNLQKIVKYSDKHSRIFNTGSKKSAKQTFDNLRDFLIKPPMKKLFCISAFEIKGDTRLDEVIYHLTKKELKGSKKLARDSILHYLSFRAGVAKAYLTALGYCWSQNMEHTNNHIGNFVVYPEHGTIEVGIVDLCASDMDYNFENGGEFLKYTEGELEYFRENLHEDTACCFPTYLRYKHFSKKLRDECFNALETGYMSCLLSHNIETKSLWPIELPKKIIFPDNFYLKEKDFKKECEKIMN